MSAPSDTLARARNWVAQQQQQQQPPQEPWQDHPALDLGEAVDRVLDLLLRFEGLSLKPYLCPSGVATIGLGSTRYLDGTPVTLRDEPITKEQALTLAEEQVRREYVPAVLRLCPVVDTPERLAALTDFAYNVGIDALRGSTLRRRVNAHRWDDVPRELMKWIYATGKPLLGLRRRREAEAALI